MSRKPLDAQLDRLASLVAAGASVRAACKTVGIPERTARRHTTEATFKNKVMELRRQILSKTIGKLTALSARAAQTLGKLLDDGDSEIRLKAARAILGDLLAVQNGAELAERLAALEARAPAGSRPYGGSY